MNLLVLGATGRTGSLVVEQALAAGHTVTALVRSPEKLTTVNSNLRVVTGQATDTAAVSRALEGVGGSNSQVTDAAGVVWRTRSIAEAAATVSIYTMIFAVALSAIKLLQASANSRATIVEEGTPLTN